MGRKIVWMTISYFQLACRYVAGIFLRKTLTRIWESLIEPSLKTGQGTIQSIFIKTRTLEFLGFFPLSLDLSKLFHSEQARSFPGTLQSMLWQ